MEIKKCAQCGQEKTIEDFSKSYKNLCKSCVAENTRDARKMVNLSKHPIVIKGKNDYVRREIAIAAMQGMLASGHYTTNSTDFIAQRSVEYAAALLNELNKKKK